MVINPIILWSGFRMSVKKGTGFASTTPHDWLKKKKLAPLFNPTRTPIVTRSHAFSRALHQLHVITLNFDWFTGLPVSFLIGYSEFTTRNLKLLYNNGWSSLFQYWNDFRLKWNSSHYGAIRSFVTSSKKVWLPDITLYNKWAWNKSLYFHIFSLTAFISLSYSPAEQYQHSELEWKEMLST